MAVRVVAGCGDLAFLRTLSIMGPAMNHDRETGFHAGI